MATTVPKTARPFKDEDTYVFGLSEHVLSSLQQMYFDSETTREVSPLVTEPPKVLQRTHVVRDKDYYKSDLHRLNLKRQERGLPLLTEEQFEELADDLSISASEESDTEDEGASKDLRQRNTALETIFEKSIQKLEGLTVKESDGAVSHLATKSPYILFKSDLLPEEKCFGVYKSIFNIKDIEQPLDALKGFRSSTNKYSALFMVGGGHFAGAIINHKPRPTKGNVVKAGDSLLLQAVDVVVSKTFHRYTTRKKQGGSQSAMDNAKGKAKSVGSSIRRANEEALQKEIRALLKEWKPYLDECESVFVRANGPASRNIMIGYESAVLKNDDPRIRSFPFTTKRATTSELKRAWVELTYMAVRDRPSVDQKKIKQQQTEENLAKSMLQKERELKEETPEVKHSNEIVGFLKRARGPVLMAYMKKNKLDANFRLRPESDFFNTPTILHYASAHGIKGLIPVLLKSLKCDPTVQNGNGKTPYDIASGPQVRQAFQVARHELGESAFDWDAAHVGAAISREAVEKAEQEAKNKEEQEKKRLIQEELKKETPKIAGRKQRLGGVSMSQVNINSLTPEQQMRLMREQRARAAEARMRTAQNNQ